MVRKKVLKAVLASILLMPSFTPANASLDALVNLDNPRVVPILGAMNESRPSPWAHCSGYLYSSRIVFSAAHCSYIADSNGNLVLNEPPILTVGKPNSSSKDVIGRVKVVKRFVGDFKKGTTVGDLNDFIVYVLEKDLVPMEPGKLMTLAIQTDLIAANARVMAHGYGEYRDRCNPGEALPCKQDWSNPNKTPSEFPRSPIGIHNLAPKSFFPWLIGDRERELADEILFPEFIGCHSDSGGPITVLYKGEVIYIGVTPNGWGSRGCGGGDESFDKSKLGYTSPVHKHLDLIQKAEAFVAQQSAPIASTKKTVTTPNLKKTTITCTKGKLIKKVTAVKPKCRAGFKKK